MRSGIALEPHSHRADERVPLLLGVVPGQGRQFHAEALRVHVQPLEIALGHLDDKIVRHEGTALGHDRGAVVHLTLNRARNLHGLQFGLEGAREGSFDHAFKPPFEALQNTHPSGLPSAPYVPDGIRGTSADEDVLI